MTRRYMTAGVVTAVALAASLHLGAQATTPARPTAPARPAAPATPAAQPAQAPKPAAAATTGWTKKTAWGDPDLQAIWNNGTSTPMQRDKKYGTRAELTQEEYIDAARQAAVRQQGETEEQRARPGNVGAGPTFWYEVGKPSKATSMIVDPPDGQQPAITDQARAQQAERGRLLTPEGMKLDSSLWKMQGEWVRCVSRGLPAGMTPVVYNNNFQIFQAPGVVVVLEEMVHQSRIIYTDGRPHLDAAIRQWEGDARGHWEGNTLVVETTNFRPDSEPLWPGRNGTVMGAPYKVTERFTRTSATDLDYRWTLDAPSMFTRPFTASIPGSTIAASDRIMEYACIEGDNSARLTITGLISEHQRGVKSDTGAGRGGRGGGAPAGAPAGGRGGRGGIGGEE